ncbi:hypothetical protein HJFPF1_05944 [Paramyrothecium foliicola]|nr:hypothetical protein HJFPF1_05944 [Paramyrothecium foliicola]
MHAATAFTTLTLATSVVAIPTLLSSRQGFPSFRLSNARTYGNSCIPTACTVVDYSSVKIESDCGGKDCSAPGGPTMGKDDSMCDQELDVCGRKVTLVSRADGNCRPLGELNGEGDYGTVYATISENGNDVGTCYVNKREEGVQTCGLAAATTFSALVDCTFN